ncbi:cobalamin-dependent protein [Saccharothrix sp. S26]|uniref:cobalamin B12-binding domain-containing protein n=1 Tax=Saccharothrix sp. S26 TaxID=2907215 RepID=UPI001EEB5A0A|nr:cobalamin-dependent protein [Saccharothrix sp. S26]MCE6995126.1 cobalamin-dependent protein [Saccharothrix sp. S26]
MLNHLRDEGRRVLLCTVSSDSHTWNLVFLQLLLEEHGHDVTNLGSCTPDDLVVARCLSDRPDLLVISTVNGHGHADGKRLITKLRREPALRTLPVVIGGKLGIAGAADVDRAGELVEAGFDAVFAEGADLSGFNRFVSTARERRSLEGAAP